MIIKRRRAILSIKEQAEWISEESPDTAFLFIEAAEEAFSILEKNPEMGRKYASPNRCLAEIRMWRVSGFEKVLIF